MAGVVPLVAGRVKTGVVGAVTDAATEILSVASSFILVSPDGVRAEAANGDGVVVMASSVLASGDMVRAPARDEEDELGVKLDRLDIGLWEMPVQVLVTASECEAPTEVAA